MADQELDDGGRFSKQRRAYEKKREDPDDVYIGVERSEEERKKQGLPPRVGIVPYSAVAAGKERMEVEKNQRRLTAASARSPQRMPKVYWENSHDEETRGFGYTFSREIGFQQFGRHGSMNILTLFTEARPNSLIISQDPLGGLPGSTSKLDSRDGERPLLSLALETQVTRFPHLRPQLVQTLQRIRKLGLD